MRRRPIARPWCRDIGRRRVAGALDANATALNGLTLSAGQLVVPAGAVGAPSIAFASDLTTGLYRYGSSTVGVASGGALNLRVGASFVVVGDGNARLSVAGGFLYGTVTTPAAWSADVTDYDPGLNATILRVSASVAGVDWFSMINGSAGRIIWVHNVGAESINVVDEAASGTAAGKFATSSGSDLALGPERWLCTLYDGTTSRWRASLL